jgi:hypothetical protein
MFLLNAVVPGLTTQWSWVAAMDYELAYTKRRLAQERRAAEGAPCASTRAQHLTLARAFEEHLKRITAKSEHT